MPPQASSQPLNPLPHERRWVGLLLHFGLVAILAVLLVVAANGHMEHVVETPLNEFERVSNTISISLLVFITVRRQSGREYTYLTHTCCVEL
jgi:cytosine/uracil/thiamine/allantoin permease